MEWKIEYDDCGVLCLYDPRTEGWETLYDTCVECGAVWDECDCDDATECKATATREQILQAQKFCDPIKIKRLGLGVICCEPEEEKQ